MQVQKQMENEYQEYLDDLFVNDFKVLVAQLYKKQLSEAIKRGIRTKKLQKQV